MRTTLTVVGVAVAGTALGAVAYTAVSAQPAGGSGVPATPTAVPLTNQAGDAGADRQQCERPARVIGGQCVTVVHVSADPGADRGSTAAAAETAPAAPAAAAAPVVPVALPPPAPVTDDSGHDAFDDHGGDDPYDEAEDAAEDAADEAEDAADEAEDAAEDAADEAEDAADDD